MFLFICLRGTWDILNEYSKPEMLLNMEIINRLPDIPDELIGIRKQG
ncbi:hypothetical protein [Peribacillus butanolivorans]